MVRTSILLAGYGYAAEQGSLMQSHHSDLGTAEGVNVRLNKLAELQLTTKRMETEYKAMASAIINKEVDPATGKPYEAPRDGDIWSTVEKQFDELLWQLDQEQKTNQQLVTDSNARVALCNTNRDTAYSTPGTGVDARLVAQNAARTDHTSCREGENTAISTRKDSCEEFVNRALCDAHGKDYDYFAADDAGTHEDVPQHLLDAIANAGECKGHLEVEVAKSSTCDDKQTNFELKFCEYAQKLEDTCSSLDSCYQTTTEDRAAVVQGVKELEENQKIVFRMVQKVKCYVDAMKSKFKTLQNSDIQSCESKFNLVTDGARLSIDYPAAPPKAPCDKSKLNNGVPGEASWATVEYTTSVHHLHHGETYAGHGSATISKIESIVACSVQDNGR